MTAEERYVLEGVDGPEVGVLGEPGYFPPQETIGQLRDRLPPNEWVQLPEYGVQVKRLDPDSG